MEVSRYRQHVGGVDVRRFFDPFSSSMEPPGLYSYDVLHAVPLLSPNESSAEGITHRTAQSSQ